MSTKKPATPPKSELAGTDTLDRGNTNAKLQALEEFRSDATGQALRTKVKEIRQAGRPTMGTRLINLKEGDTVASVARPRTGQDRFYVSSKVCRPATGVTTSAPTGRISLANWRTRGRSPSARRTASARPWLSWTLARRGPSLTPRGVIPII